MEGRDAGERFPEMRRDVLGGLRLSRQYPTSWPKVEHARHHDEMEDFRSRKSGRLRLAADCRIVGRGDPRVRDSAPGEFPLARITQPHHGPRPVRCDPRWRGGSRCLRRGSRRPAGGAGAGGCPGANTGVGRPQRGGGRDAGRRDRCGRTLAFRRDAGDRGPAVSILSGKCGDGPTAEYSPLSSAGPRGGAAPR